MNEVICIFPGFFVFVADLNDLNELYENSSLKA